VNEIAVEARASSSSAGTEAIGPERPAVDPLRASRPRRRPPRSPSGHNLLCPERPCRMRPCSGRVASFCPHRPGSDHDRRLAPSARKGKAPPISRFTRLVPSLAAAVLISAAAGSSSVGAQDARPDGLASDTVSGLVARDAAALAMATRHDAVHHGPRSKTVVKEVSGCCGVHALEVFERARASSLAHEGVYQFILVTKGLEIQQIRITEFTAHGWGHFPLENASQLYEFLVGPTRGSWRISIGHAYHSDIHYTTGKVPLHTEEANLTAAELGTLYGQARLVLTKAEHHLPVSTEAYLHPGLPCGLPGHQACEPGGRW